MVFTISGKELTVHHTEVSEKSEGKGIGKKLLSAMVDYAREHQMRIIPLCSYVYAQFKKHADEYADVWKK